MSRKLSLIGAIAVASLFLFPIQTSATPGSKHGNSGGILNGMAVPDGAGTGGAVAGGEVMA